MLSEKVVAINSGTEGPSATGRASLSSAPDAIVVTLASQANSDSPIPLAALYPFLSSEDGEVFQVINLVDACVLHLESAHRIDPNADYIAFDEFMMRARSDLRALFALRQIGDGLGSVINAVLWGLKNSGVEPLTRRQLSTVIASLSELKRKPLMHFDTAMTLLDQLEDAGLNIEPSPLASLIELEY